MVCLFGRHVWDGCCCVKCGQTRHDFEVTEVETADGDGCCWDVSQPCIGPHCGTPCDSWYPGRAGMRTVTLRCRYCGKVELRQEPVEDPR